MRRLGAGAASALLAGLTLAGCSTDAPRDNAGQVTATASIDAFQIALGDCTGPMKEGNVMSLQVVPCEQEHYFEAYARTDLPDGDYPGEDSVADKADWFCSDEFKTFIGVTATKSDYDMFYLYPIEDSWATGDREVMCLVGSSKGGVKGTLRGAEK
ncbi:septum formation family protein [Micropruina sp.]|uniref:septum formation family protein n=1 Tax=Micropruina sp. TaxID=2737536 RepID=UPI0039E52017